MQTVTESQGLELLTVLQSHGSQGPSHSFQYEGQTNALKGTVEEGGGRGGCVQLANLHSSREGHHSGTKEELERLEFKIAGKK